MAANRRQISGMVIRAALLKVLPASGEPASTRDLVTAVYHHTGNDLVSYGNVTTALRALAKQGAVVGGNGTWSAVPE